MQSLMLIQQTHYVQVQVPADIHRIKAQPRAWHVWKGDIDLQGCMQLVAQL